jgi:hypothetical protein
MKDEWEPQFLEEVQTFHGALPTQAARGVLEGVHERGLGLYLEAPQGNKGMGFMVVVPGIDWEPTPVASHGKTGTIGWELPNPRRGNPFKRWGWRSSCGNSRGAVPGMDLSYPHYPKTRYAVLGAEEGVPVLLAALDWTVARLRGSNRV